MPALVNGVGRDLLIKSLLPSAGGGSAGRVKARNLSAKKDGIRVRSW